MVRIRKNLKLSPPPPQPVGNFADVAHRDLQPHICKLNQSPWDYYYSPSYSSFNLLDSSSSSPPLLLQFQSGEGLVGNGSLGRRSSITALHSVVSSPMDIDKPEVAVVAGDAFNNAEKVIVRCQRTDGRSWQCKKEAKEGSLLCDHHLTRSSIGLNSNVITNKNCNIRPSDFTGSNQDNGTVPAKTRRGRPKKGAIPNSGKPDDEFYNYSGFGPSERNRNKKGKMEAEKDENTNKDSQPSSLPHNVGNAGQLDYMEDEFDDEDESDEEGGGGNGCGPRKMRRPVKARSLMSIINVRAN